MQKLIAARIYYADQAMFQSIKALAVFSVIFCGFSPLIDARIYFTLKRSINDMV
jgi:hypothetical protein